MTRPVNVLPRRADAEMADGRTPRIIIGKPAPGAIAIPEGFELGRFATSINMANLGLNSRGDGLVEAFVTSIESISTDYPGIRAFTEFREKIFDGVDGYPNSANFLSYADTVRMNIRKELNRIRLNRVHRDELDLALRNDSPKVRREQKERDRERIDVLNSLLTILNNAETVMIRQKHTAELDGFLSGLTMRNDLYAEEVIQLGEFVLVNRASQVPTLRYVVSEAQRDQALLEVVRGKYPDAPLRPPWVSPEAKLVLGAPDIENIIMLTNSFTTHDGML